MTAHPVLPDGPCCPDTILTVSTSSETRSSVSTQSRSHAACSVRQLPNAQETLEKRQRPSPRAPRAAATCFGSTSLGPGKRRLSPQTAHSCGHQPKRPLPGCGAWKEDPPCGMGDGALQRSPAAPRAALGSLRSVGRWPRRSLKRRGRVSPTPPPATAALWRVQDSWTRCGDAPTARRAHAGVAGPAFQDGPRTPHRFRSLFVQRHD